MSGKGSFHSAIDHSLRQQPRCLQPKTPVFIKKTGVMIL